MQFLNDDEEVCVFPYRIHLPISRNDVNRPILQLFSGKVRTICATIAAC